MRLKLDVVTIEGGRRVARSFPLELPPDSAIQGIRIYGPEGLIYSDLYAYPDEADWDPDRLTAPPATPTTLDTATTPTTPTTP